MNWISINWRSSIFSIVKWIHHVITPSIHLNFPVPTDPSKLQNSILATNLKLLPILNPLSFSHNKLLAITSNHTISLLSNQKIKRSMAYLARGIFLKSLLHLSVVHVLPNRIWVWVVFRHFLKKSCTRRRCFFCWASKRTISVTLNKRSRVRK